MSPKELLAATESALGESELKRQHEELVAAKASIGDLEKSVAADAGRLERLRGENEALERDVARFKKREEKLALVKLQRAKLPWLHYEAARRRHDEAKAAEAEAKRQAAAKEAAAAVASAPLAAAEAEERSAAADLKPLSKAAGDADAAAIEARDAAGAAGDKVDAAAHAVAAAKKKAASRAAELASRERRLADAQAAAALAASAPPPNQAEADDVRARLRAESARAREAEAAADEARDGLRPLAAAVATLTAQLEELQRESNARLKALMARHANRGLRDGLEAARRAVAAGQLSPAGFVGPVLFEVQVREKVHANMLEQAVPQWLWAALVVTCKARAARLPGFFGRRVPSS